MKKIYNLLFLLTALMTYSSCTSEVDDVFDKSSSERIEETMSNTNAILKANTKGWIMKYYANSLSIAPSFQHEINSKVSTFQHNFALSAGDAEVKIELWNKHNRILDTNIITIQH